LLQSISLFTQTMPSSGLNLTRKPTEAPSVEAMKMMLSSVSS
jgi:hypothetical protein